MSNVSSELLPPRTTRRATQSSSLFLQNYDVQRFEGEFVAVIGSCQQVAGRLRQPQLDGLNSMVEDEEKGGFPSLAAHDLDAGRSFERHSHAGLLVDLLQERVRVAHLGAGTEVEGYAAWEGMRVTAGSPA